MMIECVNDTELRLWLSEEYVLPYYEITKNGNGTFALRDCSNSEFAPISFDLPDLTAAIREVLNDISLHVCYQLQQPDALRFFGENKDGDKVTTAPPEASGNCSS